MFLYLYDFIQKISYFIWQFQCTISAGNLTSPGSCVNSLSELEVQYEGFTSRLDILMYYVAVSNNTEANHTSCKEYVSRLCYHFIVAKKKKKLLT